LDLVVDWDCGFSLGALDGAVVNGRDIRVLGARNCNREDEASARVANKEERGVIMQVIHMTCAKSEAKARIVNCQVPSDAPAPLDPQRVRIKDDGLRWWFDEHALCQYQN
jgi:hypothetical protein